MQRVTGLGRRKLGNAQNGKHWVSLQFLAKRNATDVPGKVSHAMENVRATDATPRARDDLVVRREWNIHLRVFIAVRVLARLERAVIANSPARDA
jgi:hypothetical protein